MDYKGGREEITREGQALHRSSFQDTPESCGLRTGHPWLALAMRRGQKLAIRARATGATVSSFGQVKAGARRGAKGRCGERTGRRYRPTSSSSR